MNYDLAILSLTAISIGFVHTLIGPDHYVPFIAMSGARGWSLRRTLGITAACGVGHVLGSLVLGAVGILLGWALTRLTWLEGVRGNLAGWMLLGFGVAYTAWGLRQAVRNRPHTHWHSHGDGTLHQHVHVHAGNHAHVHAAAARVSHGETVRRGTTRSITPWILFTIFVFGPCETLVPVLMYPAAAGSWLGVATVAGLFALATITTMLGVVTLGYLGLTRLGARAWQGNLERYSHALAGLALVACGLAIQVGL